MFTEYLTEQYNAYKTAYQYYEQRPQSLIEIEKFVMRELLHFADLNMPEIIRDYNEASYLYPFWKNYPPLDRGRDPRGDQYPWIEVGEQVFGNKLSRYFANNFHVKDSGLPSGTDDRCIISSERIKQILGITDSVWVFIDIKSAGPRDDFNHAVMSPYQVSGSGSWDQMDDGVFNAPIEAKGVRASHNFLCSLPPIYILSDGTIAPLVTFAIKPVYSMLTNETGENIGQPLNKIKIACIPNGILLTKNPNYNAEYPGLFYPGKDDKGKDLRKIRARVSFDLLQKIASWRVANINI
ncbi:MAG: BglI family type II restriction endonuclease [Bacteroides sp.]|nr:BglI family type II restriction endonuclease [Bacteroides sp.]MBD5354255.1 BglI family type II restriction endonuclease [Bacteroides sp.]MDE5828159.1 BglI family type II restriction endonuclease [Duncaniella sp.]MDE6430177.1 BglI family type II restriction endonuclease [Duncaniella sp.]MDE6812768.1 BglI family type II restriction endonuclease [Duncaniella sp.]